MLATMTSLTVCSAPMHVAQAPRSRSADDAALLDPRQLDVAVVGAKQGPHLFVEHRLDFLFQPLRHDGICPE